MYVFVTRVVKVTHILAAPCQDDASCGRFIHVHVFCVTRVVKMIHLWQHPVSLCNASENAEKSGHFSDVNHVQRKGMMYMYYSSVHNV